MILRNFTRHLLRSNRGIQPTPIDVAVCIDIECTCDSPVQIQPMELIEIACIKVDLKDSSPKYKRNTKNNVHLDSYSMFHSFVKPVMNPNLTFFCQDLTGIAQSTVDKSDTVDKVLGRLIDWLHNEELIDQVSNEKKTNFAFASCGNFDLNLLSPTVERHKFKDNLELPIYFKEWINVKKTFVNHKGEWPKGLYHMLDILGEEPSGRLHSAKDDCKNLARIVECLHFEGCKFYVTNKRH